MWGRERLLLSVNFLLKPSGLGQVVYSCYLWAFKDCAVKNKSPSFFSMHFPIFSSEQQQQEMHRIRTLASKRPERLLRKCQGHLCCSKRVWNEDGKCVTLRWEVITGSSKAADYDNFTGHSLLGHNIFYPLHLCDTFTLGNESRSVLSSNMH